MYNNDLDDIENNIPITNTVARSSGQIEGTASKTNKTTCDLHVVSGNGTYLLLGYVDIINITSLADVLVASIMRDDTHTYAAFRSTTLNGGGMALFAVATNINNSYNLQIGVYDNCEATYRCRLYAIKLNDTYTPT